MVDTTNELITNFQDLEVDPFDAVMIFILQNKLDPESRAEWQRKIGATADVPKLEAFLEFLETQCHIIEEVNRCSSFKKSKKVGIHTVTHNEYEKCTLCKSDHSLYKCPTFQGYTIDKRREVAKASNLCFNCMRAHRVYECTSKAACKTCGKKHHSMLHPMTTDKSEAPKKSNPKHSDQSQSNLVNQENMWTVLLATAIIELRNVNGDFIKLRALIDQGSQNSFITEYAANLLGLKRERASVIISGIGSATRKCRGQVPITMKEKWSNGEISTIALIIDTITKPLPSATISNDGHIGLTPADLADPDYRTKGRIDVLLGADIYGDILLDGIIHGTPTA
ncbi:uncharacterized protein LOC119648418 [Hermetia illucens]|uniref:uncharacterized protein LOC119648417 n=1 Tax=Hermetia illucens TaxID=343691 RepID=UPI0018CC2EB6|nr:uncharacterized protein LOC119648417 [Hermetia illucens]XP_037906098.1 uncharacterized protein LOC119648418 [Hermetia illucens]